MNRNFLFIIFFDGMNRIDWIYFGVQWLCHCVYLVNPVNLV